MDTYTAHEQAQHPRVAGQEIEFSHITALSNLRSIAEGGLRPGVYLSGDEELAAYYRETIEDDGAVPVVLVVSLSQLDSSALEPDYPGIAEPITTVLGLREEEVHAAWAMKAGSWEDSLELVKSVRYRSPIPANSLRVVAADGMTMALDEYLRNV